MKPLSRPLDHSHVQIQHLVRGVGLRESQKLSWKKSFRPLGELFFRSDQLPRKLSIPIRKSKWLNGR